MRLTSLADWNCSIAKTLDVVGEWWTLLILRDAFRGTRRFDDFHASLGMARTIYPVNTMFDGDTVFALATGEGGAVEPAMLARLGSAAASCLARAIMRAVMAAEPLGGLPSWRQLWAIG